MKVPTINVIEYVNGSVTSLRSFSKDHTGTVMAEKLFREIAKEMGVESEVDINIIIGEGVLEQGDYQVFLVRSTE